MRKAVINDKVLWVFWGLIVFCHVSLFGQFGNSTSRYMHTQYFINPAYSGTLNTMSVNVMARKQWMGIEGAPTSYHLAVHAPVNNTMMSVGGGFELESYGVNKLYSANVSYAYLLKISELTFLSLGLNTNLNNYQIGYSKLALTHENDPNFSAGSRNTTGITAGCGAFLYSQSFFAGLSVAHWANIKQADADNGFDQVVGKKYFHVVSGYMFQINRSLVAKPSVWYRSASDFSEVNLGMQAMYRDLLWYGILWSESGWLSNVFHVQITKDLGVGYAFDFAIGEKSINRNNHEISLSYKLNDLIVPNKNREFGEKRTRKLLKSVRDF
ncbi:PorP/SprF family type IX secretion system membrane protein [Plebeiibacterium marinum]|uniref:Type IX secretion system membrane protein PorP/SprF n=1 Tax=Plebeiibacterium marinum TaxID=2992111 RepID=A0AAE3MDJ8_9BACT|nr:type IX secretion system membrane protein PorP/SprF [Plebeiobacterium marinum]MCW3805617.1 type IX secretion system membrane protein PorP/SprF [Plebeiobacterium marinum]